MISRKILFPYSILSKFLNGNLCFRTETVIPAVRKQNFRMPGATEMDFRCNISVQLRQFHEFFSLSIQIWEYHWQTSARLKMDFPNPRAESFLKPRPSASAWNDSFLGFGKSISDLASVCQCHSDRKFRSFPHRETEIESLLNKMSCYK